MIVGTCVDSFDENGDCVNDLLPCRDVSHFACDGDEYGNNFEVDGVAVSYDDDTDIHTFVMVSQ
jgi:hypothetical protein